MDSEEDGEAREVEKQGTCIHFRLAGRALGVPGGRGSIDMAGHACMCPSSPPCTPRLRARAPAMCMELEAS